MKVKNKNMVQQLGRLDNNIDERMDVKFVALTSLLTQQFSVMATSSSHNIFSTCISSLLLNPLSYGNIVTNTSFPFLHIHLPIQKG